MEQEKKPLDVKALIEKGKAKGSLSNSDIMEAIEFADYDIDQIEKIYDQLEANGIESEIDRLTEKRFILKEHAEMIDRSAIEKFLKSDCFRTIKNASEINREYRFNIKLRASEFTATPELKAELMDDFVFVQGIIDCYIRDKSGDIILIDYKTDAVPKSVIGNKDAENDFFTERHGEQLRYYRTALKLLTGKEVKRTFIYSFALCREIEINN